MTYNEMPLIFKQCLMKPTTGSAFVDIRDRALWHSTLALMGIGPGETQPRNYYRAGVIISQGDYCHLKNLLRLLETTYDQNAN